MVVVLYKVLTIFYGSSSCTPMLSLHRGREREREREWERERVGEGEIVGEREW